MARDVGHRDRCAIVGVGETDYSRDSGRSALTLAAQAARAAVADAGLAPSDVDGIVRCELDDVGHSALARALGIRELSYWGSSGVGGAAPGGMVAQAVGAIVSGQARHVLVFRSLNGRSGGRYGRPSMDGQSPVGGHGTFNEFYAPYGLVAPGQMFALMARRHMIEFGTTSDQLGAIAVTSHARANANPRAQRHDRQLTLEGYRRSRFIADPLRYYDYCLETDGAAAVVVTSAERARDRPSSPVLIRAVAQADDPSPQAGSFLTALARPSLTTHPSAALAPRLYRRAGLGPADIDVAQLYDCFTITVLIQLEDYGFCPKGEGGAFVEDGHLDVDGTIPVNTSGGHLAEGYLHGMNHLVEGVRQLRGTSTSPVADAQTCLVTSGLPVATSAVVLSRG